MNYCHVFVFWSQDNPVSVVSYEGPWHYMHRLHNTRIPVSRVYPYAWFASRTISGCTEKAVSQPTNSTLTWMPVASLHAFKAPFPRPRFLSDWRARAHTRSRKETSQSTLAPIIQYKNRFRREGNQISGLCGTGFALPTITNSTASWTRAQGRAPWRVIWPLHLD